jgi:hypothetical protein
VTDEPDDPPVARDDRSSAQPLDYFAAHAPDAPARPPGLSIGWMVLALGWVPFICGIVNSVATVRSGVQDVIDAHENAAILFSALGILTIIVSIVLFVRGHDGLGFLAGIISLVVAGGMAGCLIGLR